MALRLAFSVATALRPEILIVDEALAVGDVLFQQKCFDRIRAFCEAGTTLLFVSHSMSAVYSLCSRAILIHGGGIAIDGPPKNAIDLYNALALRARNPDDQAFVIAGDTGTPDLERPASADSPERPCPSPTAGAPASDPALDPAGSYATPGVSIVDVQLLHDGRPVDAFISESSIAISVHTRFHSAYDDPHVGFQIRDHRGEPVFMTNTHCMSKQIGAVRPGEEVVVTFRFRASLAPGDYSITAGVANGALLDGLIREPLYRIHHVRTFTVLRNMDSIIWSGVYNLAPDCTIVRSPVPSLVK